LDSLRTWTFDDFQEQVISLFQKPGLLRKNGEKNTENLTGKQAPEQDYLLQKI